MVALNLGHIKSKEINPTSIITTLLMLKRTLKRETHAPLSPLIKLPAMGQTDVIFMIGALF